MQAHTRNLPIPGSNPDLVCATKSTYPGQGAAHTGPTPTPSQAIFRFGYFNIKFIIRVKSFGLSEKTENYPLSCLLPTPSPGTHT